MEIEDWSIIFLYKNKKLGTPLIDDNDILGLYKCNTLRLNVKHNFLIMLQTLIF